MKLTHQLLAAAGACVEQLAIFDRVFPGGAEVNYANAEIAADAGMTVVWLLTSRKFTNPLWVKASSIRQKQISVDSFRNASECYGHGEEYARIIRECLKNYDRAIARLVVDIITGKEKITTYLDADGNFRQQSMPS